jgi:hypothetical protein
MEPINPYASPQETGPPEPLPSKEERGAPGGVWRDGRYLVMHRRAQLPARCVKSNRPATRRLRGKFEWHHPALYAALPFAFPFLYLLLAIVLSERAAIHFGLSEEWFARRRRRTWGAYGLLLAAWLSLLGAGLPSPVAVSIALICFAGLLIAAIYSDISARMVTPARITKDYVWLKRVHPDFLASFPPWPGNG